MRDVPTALSAALSARYRIERELGTGGMATVYLARDLKHDRDVAIKVLKAEVASAVGVDRFLAEIKTTGHLKHPHILPLFDSGSADSLLFYVMPFIDGESLRARLLRAGPLPIGEVVRILRQLADALAYAHTKGVIHRDVKSDNVLVSDRQVFLADFGIARALAADTTAPTMTGAGMMMGTPAYMAPEQVAAGPVDHRTDIYAFGALAYELLTGSPPFAGTPQKIIAAQLTQPPEPVTRHRPETPPVLAALIMRCLQKEPGERWQSADDVLAVLESVATSDVVVGVPELASTKRRRREVGRRMTYAALALLALASIVAAWYAIDAMRTPPLIVIGRITHVTSEPGLELDPAIAPDKRTIAYVAGPPGRMRIYLRQLEGGRIVPLLDEGVAEGQRWPQWSPDGSRLVFQAGRQGLSAHVSSAAGMLYQTPALGGTPRKLFGSVPGGLAISPSWSPDGTRIAFAGSGGLYIVPPDGDGVPRVVAAGSDVHSPRWSPDGNKIAYVSGGSIFTFGEESLGNVSTSTVMMVTLDNGRVTQITKGDWLDTNPVWMPDSRTLLFISSRAGGRDVYTIRLTPGGQPDREPERLTSGLNAHTISVSTDGKLLAYASYAPSANIWSIGIPEEGVASIADAKQITFGNEKIEKLAISEDGQWLAYDSDRNGYADIWKQPLAGGPAEQVTRGPYHKFVNGWSPDGREIVFHSIREGGQRDVFVVSADGTHTEAVTTGPAEEQHAAWGPDGNTIVFDSSQASGDKNLLTNVWEAFIATRSRRGEPWGVPRQLTKHGSADPKWSPDGRLIAFCVRGQLRVIAPDGTGERALVDIRAGTEDPEPAYPVWSRDSRTIYYKAYDRDRHSTIWSVPVTGGAARLLVRFDDPSRRSLRREFATDGQRFYFTVARDESDIWAMELLTK
jgi:Tol biopolymer transport system component/predicted Ser/Thr protein kinase